jgi:hypothetical protein
MGGPPSDTAATGGWSGRTGAGTVILSADYNLDCVENDWSK